MIRKLTTTELERRKDAETLTVLTGIRMVGKEIETKEVGIETLRVLFPRTIPRRELLKIMRQPMPRRMIERASQTYRTISPRTPREAVESLARSFSREEEEEEESKIPEHPIDKYMLVKEVLDYLMECMFWITTPLLYGIKVKIVNQEIQTDVRYDKTRNIMVMDIDIQTELSCEPRLSTGKLLAQYEEVRSFIQSELEQCFTQGIEPRIIIDDLIDEIVAKGANIIKYPMSDQLIQTVASYKTHVKHDEDVLRKLRMSVVVDPSEASMIVAPLIVDLLGLTCDVVAQDARQVVKNILCTMIRRVIVIGSKLEAIMRQPERPTTEQIFLQRKKKIADFMMKKRTETVATQTGLAGVPEIARLKPKDILCSVCARESICDLCLTAQEASSPSPKEDTKIRRTQDILLAYNPCYVVATVSEEEKNPHLQSTGTTRKKIGKPTIEQLPISQYAKLRSEETHIVRDNETIDVLMTPRKRVQVRDSVSGWTRVINDTLIKSWCSKDSAANVSNVSTTSSATKSSFKSTSCCKKPSQPGSVPALSSQEKALQILKNAFCTRATCLDALLMKSMEHRLSIKDTSNENNLCCNVENCPLNLDRHHERPINNINGQICARLRADKFRAVFARPSSEF